MKYGFIGCGNMGGALARALSKSTQSIALANRTPHKAEILADELGLGYGTNEDIIRGCKIVFLAVKPQMVAEVIDSLRDLILDYRPVLVSMIAGLSMSKLEEMISTEYDIPIVRIMPNTTVAIGKGLIQYCKNEFVDDTALNELLNDLSPAGIIDEIPESLCDICSVIGGCTPAFAYMFFNALADGAVACGLPRDKAFKYVESAIEGAAALALESDKHPEQLKDEVCSPGGTTIRGVKALEENGFRNAAFSAVLAAYEKNKNLGK